MDEKALIPGRSYHLKIGTQTLQPWFQNQNKLISIRWTIWQLRLELNEIGVTNLTTEKSIPAPYAENSTLEVHTD